MTFEEDFPSLKHVTFKEEWDDLIQCECWEGSWVSKSSIEQFCLDKQRVREIIEKAKFGIVAKHADGHEEFIDLREHFMKTVGKELGL